MMYTFLGLISTKNENTDVPGTNLESELDVTHGMASTKALRNDKREQKNSTE